MASVIIREANRSDCSDIAALIQELAAYEKLENEAIATADTLEQSLFGPQPYAFALLAEAGGKLAGFCIYFHNFSTFLGKPGIYIEDIFVREMYRGLGIGKLFFARISEIAKQKDCGRIEWWVLDWNQPAIDFYAKMGAEAMAEWTVYRLTQDKFK